MEKHYNYNKNVFINCPFDDKYFDILQALVFCITYFGFIPRISLESSDSVKPRLEKIVELIYDSDIVVKISAIKLLLECLEFFLEETRRNRLASICVEFYSSLNDEVKKGISFYTSKLLKDVYIFYL